MSPTIDTIDNALGAWFVEAFSGVRSPKLPPTPPPSPADSYEAKQGDATPDEISDTTPLLPAMAPPRVLPRRPAKSDFIPNIGQIDPRTPSFDNIDPALWAIANGCTQFPDAPAPGKNNEAALHEVIATYNLLQFVLCSRGAKRPLGKHVQARRKRRKAIEMPSHERARQPAPRRSVRLLELNPAARAARKRRSL